MKTFYLIIFIIIAISLAYKITTIIVEIYIKPVDVWKIKVPVPFYFVSENKKIKRIGDKKEISNFQYQKIFEFFVLGIDSYSSRQSANVIYPGVSGSRGSRVEGLEGFARTSTLLSAWLHGGRARNVELANKRIFDIKSHLIRGLLSGTSVSSDEYWGDINDFDQRIVESADIAITVWLLRDTITSDLTLSQRIQIFSWLDQINDKKTYGGNWLLFRIVVNSVLFELGYSNKLKQINEDYNAFKSFHVGNGWFSDGKQGAIDYYNAWQMQYMLFWISTINKNLDAIFLSKALSQFSDIFQYFIGPEGIPIFGRSCCYRLAVATPLVIMAYKNPTKWARKARRALDLTWSYFIRHSSLIDGRITQGFYEDDVDLLENYSGRASPLWSLRSLVIAFFLKADHDFWTKNPKALPIEEQSYKFDLHDIGMVIEGNKTSKEIIIHIKNNYTQTSNSIKKNQFRRMSVFRIFLEGILKRPLRIENFGAKYKKKSYSSKYLFFQKNRNAIRYDIHKL